MFARFTFLFLIVTCMPASATVDYADLADRVAASIEKNIAPVAAVETVAFWKVENHSGTSFDDVSFRDNLDIAVLNAGRFEVVDRTNLERMFKEMELSLTGLVDQREIQRFGDLYGIQAFIYGDLYNDVSGGPGNYCIVIKCIDTRTGQLIFGDMVPLYPATYKTSAIDVVVGFTAGSLAEKAFDLLGNDVDTIAVWYIEPSGDLDMKILSDKLTAKMTTIPTIRVVDRENLQKLLEEQATGVSELFNQETVAKIGKLYGVDGFVYGTAKRVATTEKKIVTENVNFTLKMVDTEKGVLRWGGRFDGTAVFERKDGPLEFPKSKTYTTGSTYKPSNGGSTTTTGTTTYGSGRSISDIGYAMVYIAGGTFAMGSNDGDDDERPVHYVTVDGFSIGATEVTNAQYCAFLNAKGTAAGSSDRKKWVKLSSEDGTTHIEYKGTAYVTDAGWEDHPVVNVSWYGADAFCEFYGLRLPTEAEWEYAAGGPNHYKYPWGNEFDGKGCCYSGYNGDGNPPTMPVKSFDANSYGLYDTAGNVWEWCGDWYDGDYYSDSPAGNPQGPGSGEYKILRGGSWGSGSGFVRCANRDWGGPVGLLNGCGFRCAGD